MAKREKKVKGQPEQEPVEGQEEDRTPTETGSNEDQQVQDDGTSGAARPGRGARR